MDLGKVAIVSLRGRGRRLPNSSLHREAEREESRQPPAKERQPRRQKRLLLFTEKQMTRKVHAGGRRLAEKVAGRIEETASLYREAEKVEGGGGGRKRGLWLLLVRAAAAVVAGGEEWLAATIEEESRAAARDVRLLRQRRRKRIVVYSNLLFVAVEGCDQQRRHSDARAERHMREIEGVAQRRSRLLQRTVKGRRLL
ncbi:hypothetical protein B296_00003053 [Ensete ventricosum]|uniref:Uncharacterized protein n=1 Tax=Ensete ventricosum TaxID=4639 RepID=A0A426ZLY1_ENSVE|nr:hypothetical protein B296_00003053 [Ensete ventricosum]